MLKLSMSIMFTIFDVSMKEKRVYGSLCFELLPQQMILFVFVALHPMSTAMVIAGRSVHLTTLFPGQA